MIKSTGKEFVIVPVDEAVAGVISFVTVDVADSIDRIFDEVTNVFVVVTVVEADTIIKVDMINTSVKVFLVVIIMVDVVDNSL